MSSAPSQPAPATTSSNRLDVQIGILFAVAPQAIASLLAAWYLWHQRHELYGGTG